MVEFVAKISPKEFRDLLPDKLKEMYDKLVENMVKMGVDKNYAELFVAVNMLDGLKGALK